MTLRLYLSFLCFLFAMLGARNDKFSIFTITSTVSLSVTTDYFTLTIDHVVNVIVSVHVFHLLFLCLHRNQVAPVGTLTALKGCHPIMSRDILICI